MNKKDRWKDWLLFILAIFILFLMIKYSNIKPKIVYNDRIKIDTITVRDTITKIKPIEKIKYIKDSIIINKDSLIIINDTIYLPRETKIYEDSLYRCVISGYQPTLDEINIFQQTKIIKEIQTKKQRFSWGLQAGFGYGIFNKRPDLFIGIGGQYNF